MRRTCISMDSHERCMRLNRAQRFALVSKSNLAGSPSCTGSVHPRVVDVTCYHVDYFCMIYIMCLKRVFQLTSTSLCHVGSDTSSDGMFLNYLKITF